VNAGNLIGYQHYAAPADLVSGSRLAFSSLLVLQAVLVVAGILAARSRLSGLSGGKVTRARLIVALAATSALSATFSRHIGDYAAELVLASLVQIVALGNVVLIASAVPATSLDSVKQSVRRLVGERQDSPQPGGADRFSLTLAALVVVLASFLSFVSYGRHPHVPDEVVYLVNADYFADGKLFLSPPPAAPAFDVDLMHMAGDKWFVPVPPGWPAVLAIGARLGLPWLVNPVLAGVSLLLAYALVRELFSRRTARLSALFLSLSPWFLFMGMNFMTHMLTLALALSAALGVARLVRTGRLAWAVAAGFSLGAMSLVRPLEALVMALLLGLWTVMATRGSQRVASVLLLVASCAVVAAVALPYNRALTGSATTFPMSAYIADNYGTGTNDMGFGGNRGLPWPGLDPFPGHGLPDVLLNAGLNLFAVNIELFGWATGSVLLIALFILSSRLNRAELMMVAALLSVIGIHSFYWFSGGPDFGARYWFLIIIPCAVLAARAVEWLSGTHFSVGGGEHEPRIFAMAAALSFAAVATFIPWRAVDKYHHYRRMRPGIEELARRENFGRALVLIRGARHPDFASAFPYGALSRGGDGPVYAWEKTSAIGAAARAAFPDRPVWVVNGPTITMRGFEVAERPNPPGGTTRPSP
jgi:hypothetical protein